MPDERIAEIVWHIDFSRNFYTWMAQLEHCFHIILKYEYYLTKIPHNLALPKYRKVIIRIIYRMLNQVPEGRLSFSNDVNKPDFLIKQILEYLIDAEVARKKAILERNPVTMSQIKMTLTK
ncbi:hypothetical protein KKA14_19675, partial [bacterium]|nr:hypothetical protein [bacterium]